MIQRECAVCGAVYQSNQPSRVTCSSACKSRRKREALGPYTAYTLTHAGGYEARCRWCGQTFTAHPKVRTTYCSRKCSYSGRAGSQHDLLRSRRPACAVHFGTCVECGVVYASRFPRKVCGGECLRRWVGRYGRVRWRTRNPLAPVVCLGCGVLFVRDGKGPKRFCSPLCRPVYPYHVSPRRRGRIYKRDGWLCGICHRRIDPAYAFPHAKSATVDHIWPRSLGGDDSDANLQAAHHGCNSSKGNRVEVAQLRIAV